MNKERYSDFLGLNRSDADCVARQVAFKQLDNFISTQKRGALIKRNGSVSWDTTGDCLGFGEYLKESSTYNAPSVNHIIRHRRNGGTSFIEKLDWGTSTWSAITQGANTSFSSNGIMKTAQLGTLLCVCAGRPAKLTDISSGSLSRLGGPAPTAAPTIASSGAGTISGYVKGCYTFYDSTTGWESSPSPIGDLGVITTDLQIDWSALETTCAREGVDQKRLYRVQLSAEGAEPFYRVATIPLANTTYTDTVTDANLGAQAPESGDHDPPPTESFIVIEYANHLMIASGDRLWYSKVWDGNNYSLEYFSSDRTFRFPQRIQGLAYSPDFGRLLVLLPPGHGIWQVSGRSESEFEIDIYKKDEGTFFPSSISIYENMVGYWGPEGPKILTPGGFLEDFADAVDNLLSDITTAEYNSSVYIFSYYDRNLAQFIFGLSVTDSATALWEDTVSTLVIEWQDSTDGSTVGWQ